MSDPKAHFFVDSVASKVPVWMTRTYGWKFLLAMIIWADIGVQILFEALYLRYPGVGTATGLPYASRSRGLLRGMSDTDQSFAARLIAWIDRYRGVANSNSIGGAGTALGLARAVQDYCTGSPRVKVVNRGRLTGDGTAMMTDLAAGGASSTVSTVTWDWDSVSNPERQRFWSEMWIIVYSPPWPISGAIDTSSSATLGLGIGVKSPRVDVDNLKLIIDTWKSAHTFVRAVVFTYDATLFNPSTPSTMPDGTWGEWGYGKVARAASGRGTKELNGQIRTWEPELPPQTIYAQAT